MQIGSDVCDFGVCTWMDVVVFFYSQIVQCSAGRPDAGEVLLCNNYPSFAGEIMMPVFRLFRGGSSELALILFLFRALESGLRLAPFVKLSFTAVSSLHPSLVST